MHIEFRHLRTIKAIHEAGGLARAADQMNITQSALSHQVKGLEDQAGVELFVRRSKPLKLSPAGQRLLKLAQQVLHPLVAGHGTGQAHGGDRLVGDPVRLSVGVVLRDTPTVE